MRRPLLLAITWLVGTALAIAIVWFALGLVGGQVTDDRPATLSLAQVAAANTATTAATIPTTVSTTVPTTNPTAVPATVGATTSPPAAPVTNSFTMQGGTVVAQCSGTTASLVSAVPNNSYDLEVKNYGPDEVEVEFESETHTSKIKVDCDTGTPVGTPEEDDA